MIAAMARIARRRSGSGPRDEGRAIIEVTVLGVLVLIPVIYILIALVRLQGATLAVNEAARDVGRAMDGASSVEAGMSDARQIAEVALHDQGIGATGLTIRFVAAGAGCGSPEVAPSLRPGDIYDICVRAVVGLPGVPTVITGSANTVTGVYTLHVGELREGR